MNLSLHRVRALERSGIAKLRRPGCGRSAIAARAVTPMPTAGPAAAVGSGASPAAAGARSTSGAGGDPDETGVLGVHESHTAPALVLRHGASGSSSALRALLPFLAALLALLIGATLATRRSGVPPILLTQRLRRPSKPLLFLNVGGVFSLSPLGNPSTPPVDAHDIGTFRVYIAEDCAELLRVLATRFEVVWASGWEGDANHQFRNAPALDHDLPAVRLDDSSWGSSDWKTERVPRAAGRRPIAWIDDNFGPADHAWAHSRRAPTKLIPAESGSGLRREHVDELIGWAEDLERGSVERARSRAGS
jgi:hypothetical protein